VIKYRGTGKEKDGPLLSLKTPPNFSMIKEDLQANHGKATMKFNM
jgi:hypothetical protein